VARRKSVAECLPSAPDLGHTGPISDAVSHPVRSDGGAYYDGGEGELEVGEGGEVAGPTLFCYETIVGCMV
jgi:hypothetical protein